VKLAHVGTYAFEGQLLQTPWCAISTLPTLILGSCPAY
jgi:hypothetical protein